MHVSIPVRNKPRLDAYPELECLPGQVYEEDLEQTPDSDPELVSEDLESLCVSGCSWIEQTPDAESADSVMSPASLPSTSDLDDGESLLLCSCYFCHLLFSLIYSFYYYFHL